MEAEKDIWFWLAVWVSALALITWAVSTTIGVGSDWTPWFAGAVTMLAMLGIAVRAGIKGRSKIATAQTKEERQKYLAQYYKRQVRDFTPLVSFLAGTAIVDKLVTANLLPGWAGAALVLMLVGGWIWLWRVLHKSSA